MQSSSAADEHPMMGQGRARLTGKVAIVTGADSGIGRATARLFAREGAKVVCVDLRESGRPRVDRLIQGEGGAARFLQGDVTSPADCERMVAAARSEFGGLNILFNNAGVGVRKKLHEHTDEEWDFVVNTNLRGVFNGVRAALPFFMAEGSGTIAIGTPWMAASARVDAPVRHTSISAAQSARAP
jgi:NAD(P)-dependent dehydrogenase (short-subunit alcohol dehydrogenase family)